MLSKINRLKDKVNFTKVYRSGEKYFSPYFVMYVLDDKSPEQPVRIGIVTSKKVGGAVVRNRARRVLSEILRQEIGSIKPGLTLVFVVLAALAGTNHSTLQKNTQEILTKAGIFTTSND